MPAASRIGCDDRSVDLIPNRKLTAAHVPAFAVTALDPQNFNGGWSEGRSDEQWTQLWDFALTYDGYAYFGGDQTAWRASERIRRLRRTGVQARRRAPAD